MELEWHQLEMPYASLRAHSRERQRRLRLCVEEHGQQQPIVVVPERETSGRYVVIDGHQRIAALRRLGHDTVEALVWEMEEAEALVLRWQMANGPGSSALEQGWLLAELQHRFGWSQDELAQRFRQELQLGIAASGPGARASPLDPGIDPPRSDPRPGGDENPGAAGPDRPRSLRSAGRADPQAKADESRDPGALRRLAHGGSGGSPSAARRSPGLPASAAKAPGAQESPQRA